MSKATITISVLGKEFTVSCPEEEREALVRAARYVDARMQETQRSGKSMGIERGAVMAALNIAYELLRLREQSQSAVGDFGRRVQALIDRVDGVLREEFKEQADQAGS
ncbi:MAG: cell division protein ZapA [Gammaproteobacteria bacterium]|nr:cell division protein ZapA [Gammaproteobacteria bacterium]